MAHVQPFKALRFDAAKSTQAISVDEAMTALHPSYVLDRWRAEGLLVEEPSAMYVLEVGPERYERDPMRFLLAMGRAETADTWLPLERMDPATRMLPAPVPALAADDHGHLRAQLAGIAMGGEPDFDGMHEGRSLKLWRVVEAAELRRMRKLLEEVPVRPCAPMMAGGAALLAVAALSEPGLRIRPIHRAIRGLQTFDPQKFLALVGDYARVHSLEVGLDSVSGLLAAQERLEALSHGHHAVLLVLPKGEGKILRFRQGLELEHVPAAPKNPTLRSLDLALLNSLVLQTVLGLQDPSEPGHPHIFGVSGLEQLVKDVDAGLYQAGFGLNPPPLWELRAVMEAEQLLPPNTLEVAPLPPAGLLYLSPSA